MKRALVLLMVFITSCTGAVEEATKAKPTKRCGDIAASRGEAEVTLDVVPSVAKTAQGVAFSLRMTVREQMDLRYPDGQRYEFLVYDSSCKQVWQWSEGRFFTQALGQERLSPGEKRVFTETYQTVGPGRFFVVGTLTADGRDDLAAEGSFEVKP